MSYHPLGIYILTKVRKNVSSFRNFGPSKSSNRGKFGGQLLDVTSAIKWDIMVSACVIDKNKDRHKEDSHFGRGRDKKKIGIKCKFYEMLGPFYE